MARTRRARWTSRGESAITTRARRAGIAAMTAAAISALGIAPVQAEPRATPTRVRLEFIRGPGVEDCPDEQFLRAQTIRKMDGVDPYDAEAPLTMTASIQRRRGELTAALFLLNRDGRGLWADGFSTGKDCKVLVTAMAVSIAVLLDDDELAAAPDAPTAPPELSAAPGAPPAPQEPAQQTMRPEEPCSPDRPCPSQPVRAPAPAPLPHKTPLPDKTLPTPAPSGSSVPPAPAERFRWVAGLDAVTGLGLTPGVALGSALSIGGRWPAWSAALEVRGLSSLWGRVDAVAMSVSTITTDVVLCLNRRTLFVCGLAEIGVLRAAPSVPFDAASRLNLRVGTGVRAGIAWPLSDNLSVRAHAEVVHPVIDDPLLRHPGAPARERPVWSAPALAVALGIGLQAKL